MYAIIDIGSNSVRLMLWAGGKILSKSLKTTRLGENLALLGALSEDAIERTAHAVEEFAESARSRGAQVFAFATAAVRSSTNGNRFVERVKELSGLDVDVVSGEREAQLALFGALGEEDGGVIDIGGASTEIVARERGAVTFLRSLPLGAVRIRDACGEDREAMNRFIEREFCFPAPKLPDRCIVIGGTATALAALKLGLEPYDPEKVDGCPLTLCEAGELADRLLSLPVEARRSLKGMDVRRADIIAGGAYLLKTVMQKLRLKCVSVSDRDNLEGYLHERGLV